MNESKALTVLDFDTMQRMSLALYKSGYFSDVKSEAQAIVKVMAGNELGIPPFASMAGIHIIQGKPTLGANLIATLVKNDPRYDYQVIHCDNGTCHLAWYENGTKVGESMFTIKEAQGAGLAGKDNWKKYTSDMLFARALTRGARRYAPGIFGGSPVYTPDELGADVDPDGYVEGEILEHIDKAQEPVDISESPMAEVIETPPGDTPEDQILNAPDPEPEPAKNGNGNGKLMSAEKYREWCAKEYGYEDPEHVFNTMKLMGFDRTPMDKETRKRLAEALAVYRVHRKKGLSQDDALAEVDAFFKEPAEEGHDG